MDRKVNAEHLTKSDTQFAQTMNTKKIVEGNLVFFL